MSDLSNELRVLVSYLRKDGYAESPDLVERAAEELEAAEWKPIADIPAGVPLGLVGGWFRRDHYSSEKEWRTDKYWMSDRAINVGYTHYFILPAPPAERGKG